MSLITLISDIGHPDYLVGIIKSKLMRAVPDMPILDITHNVTPFNYPQAAYICRNTFQNFPDYTYHIILINLFDANPKQLLLAFHNNQYILCADNGLLTMILEETPEIVIGLPIEKGKDLNALTLVEVMGQAIHRIANGEPIKDIGIADATYIEKKPIKPSETENLIEGHIIFIDSFGNVVVNITKDIFEGKRKGRNYNITIRNIEGIRKISNTYADVHEGEKLALFNSANYLEIAINKGNAAGLFGLIGYSEKSIQSQLSYQTVKIHFL
ncbi:MAG: SAM-dependent chlorinase/fluorinase [Bacteroidetes bacterium]|nr:SAM-dependent chlorinase/fluorinase [Bacteroidota bacterium]